MNSGNHHQKTKATISINDKGPHQKLQSFLRKPEINNRLQQILGGSVICVPTNNEEAFTMNKDDFLREYQGEIQNMYKFNIERADNKGIRLVRKQVYDVNQGNLALVTPKEAKSYVSENKRDFILAAYKFKTLQTPSAWASYLAKCVQISNSDDADKWKAQFVLKYAESCPEAVVALFMSNPSDSMQCEVVDHFMSRKDVPAQGLGAHQEQYLQDMGRRLKVDTQVLKYLMNRFKNPQLPLCDLVIMHLMNDEHEIDTVDPRTILVL